MTRVPLVLSFLAVVLYSVFVLMVSSIPPDKIVIPFQSFEYIDKVYHFCEYGFLGILLARLVYWLHAVSGGQDKKRWLLDFYLVVFFLGAFDEFWQSLFNRSTTLDDFFADVVGATVGGLFYLLLIRQQKKVTQENPTGPNFKFRERLIFNSIFLVICAFIFVILNLLNYKTLFFAGAPHFVLSLIEVGLMLMVMVRFYFLFQRIYKDRPVLMNS